MSNCLNQLVAILAKQTKKDPAEITAGTSLEDIGIDSFDFIEFMFLVEDEFGIEVNINYNDVAGRFATVGDVARAVDALIEAKDAGRPMVLQPTAAA